MPQKARDLKTVWALNPPITKLDYGVFPICQLITIRAGSPGNSRMTTSAVIHIPPRFIDASHDVTMGKHRF